MRKHQCPRMSARLVTWAIGLCMTASPVGSIAADTYLSGTISNITSTPSGLMLILDNGVPTNCSGTPYGWMLIPEANKTMVATALLMWTSANRKVTVYTNATTPGNFCTINQLDPH